MLRPNRSGSRLRMAWAMAPKRREQRRTLVRPRHPFSVAKARSPGLRTLFDHPVVDLLHLGQLGALRGATTAPLAPW